MTRLFYVLGEQGLLNSDICTAPADVLILPMTEDLSEAISLATDLRAAGVSTQIYTEKKKFKAKMNYADKLKVPYVYFLGEERSTRASCPARTCAPASRSCHTSSGTPSGALEGSCILNRELMWGM